MSHDYQIRIKDTNGAVQAILAGDDSDLGRIEFHHVLVGIGGHQITLDLRSVAIAELVLDAQVEIYRRTSLIDWYLEYEGFHRTQTRAVASTGRRLYNSFGRHYNDLLRRRAIAFRTGTAGAKKSDAAETVMKDYVEENAGPSATIPPRLVDGVTSGLTVLPSAGGGGAWAGNRSYRNLIDVVKEIALANLVDFRVEGTGPAIFQFDARVRPWGLDRSRGNPDGNPEVIFDLDMNNMGTPIYSLNRTEEITRVIVMGQGVETARIVEIVDAAAAVQDASPWNVLEKTRDARQELTRAALVDVGNDLLDAGQARESFAFDLLDNEQNVYGRDFVLGDIVTAVFEDIERDFQIVGVDVIVDDGKENITFQIKAPS